MLSLIHTPGIGVGTTTCPTGKSPGISPSAKSVVSIVGSSSSVDSSSQSSWFTIL